MELMRRAALCAACLFLSVLAGCGLVSPTEPLAGPVTTDGEPILYPLDLSTEALAVRPEQAQKEPEGPLTAAVKEDTPLFRQFGGQGDVLATVPAGETLTVLEETSVLWFRVQLPDGTAGYLYGEDLYLTDETGAPARTDLTRQRVEEKLAALRQRFPEGKYWNHAPRELSFDEDSPDFVTDIPCDHFEDGQLYCNLYRSPALSFFPEYDYFCECLGFAWLLSDQVFGQNAPVYTFEDLRQLRPGDQIRMLEYEHSIIVLKTSEKAVTVAEVNENYEDCRISWSREIPWDELEELSWDLTLFSRYPYWRTRDGKLLTREPV